MKKIGLLLTLTSLTTWADTGPYGEPAFNKKGASFPGDSSEYLNPIPVGEIRQVQTLSATKHPTIEYPDITKLGKHITASMKELSKKPQFRKRLQQVISSGMITQSGTDNLTMFDPTANATAVITAVQHITTDPQAKQALQQLLQMMYNAHTEKLSQEAPSEESLMNMYHMVVRLVEACFGIQINKTAITDTDRGIYKRN